MDERKWRRFFKSEMDKEMQEIDGILEQMNRDPETKDVVAPEIMHDNLMRRIDEYKARQARLSEEEKELIQLGKVYKTRSRWTRVAVLAAVMIATLATVGITSMGGPEKLFKKVVWFLGDKEKINVDTDSDRVQEPDNVSELEAYQQVEDVFGFYPVRLYYLPAEMTFQEVNIDKVMQNVVMIYKGTEGEVVSYIMHLNYRTSSIGFDFEDCLEDEYTKEVNDVVINIREYIVDENGSHRYMVSYEYQDVYYDLRLTGISRKEANTIIENLYFSK